jgi:hypothetical protein
MGAAARADLSRRHERRCAAYKGHPSRCARRRGFSRGDWAPGVPVLSDNGVEHALFALAANRRRALGRDLAITADVKDFDKLKAWSRCSGPARCCYEQNRLRRRWRRQAAAFGDDCQR